MGAGLFTVKFAEFEVPPPGVGIGHHDGVRSRRGLVRGAQLDGQLGRAYKRCGVRRPSCRSRSKWKEISFH